MKKTILITMSAILFGIATLFADPNGMKPDGWIEVNDGQYGDCGNLGGCKGPSTNCGWNLKKVLLCVPGSPSDNCTNIEVPAGIKPGQCKASGVLKGRKCQMGECRAATSADTCASGGYTCIDLEGGDDL